MQPCCGENSSRFFLFLLAFGFLVVDVGHSNAHDDLTWQNAGRQRCVSRGMVRKAKDLFRWSSAAI